MSSIGKVTDRHGREIETNRNVSQRGKTVRMYLRIKPTGSATPRDGRVYRILDSTTISTKFPSSETNGGNWRRARSGREASDGGRHAFTRIFGSESSQAEVFERSIKHRLADFLGGESSTIMTYGARDSGKTYTLFGTPASPGIIPRSVELVFSAINCTLTPWYKPTWRGTVLSLNEMAQTREARRRARLLSGRSMDAKRVAAAARRSLENSQPVDADTEGREECGDGGSMYAVWLSFAEIYNGNVYDLLDGSDGGAETQRSSADNDGRVSVRDLRAVYATTALEALRILGAGQSRLNAAATPSNPASSRSHGIFTMRLMRYQKERAADEVAVSTLTFCDLAGSRQFTGDRRERSRAREASYVNSSLLVLGRCLKAMSQNRAAPFRESKLTRMFQHALSGREDLTLIINVVFAPDLYAETRSIFGFCIAARKLLAESREKLRERSRELEARNVRNPERRDDDVVASSPVRQTPSGSTKTGDHIDSLACGDVREHDKRLIEESQVTRCNILNQEYPVRQELADHYSRVIDELEATYKRHAQEIETEECDLFKWSVRQIESFYRERIDSLTRHKKRKRADSGDHVEDNRARYVELEAENARIASAAAVLQEALRRLRRENQAILCERNKCGFELALATTELRKFRELARAGIRKWGGYGDDVEDECLVNNLERLMDEKIGMTERKLAEMNEHVRAMKSEDVEVASGTVITKRRLSRSEDLSDEASTARTRELEEELARKEAHIVTLKHRVQTQEKQLAEIQRRSNENTRDRKWNCDRPTSVSFGDSIVDSFFDTPVRSAEKNSSTPSTVAKQRELNDWIAGPTLFATQTHVESPKKRSSNVICDADRGSFLSCAGSVDCGVSRSSDRSSKDDSGISSGSRSRRTASVIETEDKCTQTYVTGEENNDERVETDRADSISRNPEEVSHLVELSRELEIIGSVIRALDEAACANEREISRCESQSSHEEDEEEEASERSTGNERRIATEQDSVLKTTEDKTQGYKREVDGLSPGSTIKEENGDRTKVECLERYMERSKFFENQLLWMRGQLDRVSDKCEKEHLSRIERLEEEVSRKTQRINELNGRIVRIQRELAKDLEVFEKVDDFEIIVDRWRRDKNELYRQLRECSETQLTLEDKLTELTMLIAEREKRLASLRGEVRDVTYLNIANNEEAKKRLGENMCLTEGELRRCEDSRENLENVVRAKIDNFRFRFPDYQNNNAGFLNNIWRAYDDSQDEITRLNLQLRGKEREIILLKNDRDVAIQKYKNLKRYIRSEIDVEKENIKAVRPNDLDNPERCFTEKNMCEGTDFLKKLKVINDERQLDEERDLTSNISLISKRVSLEALDISSVLSEDFTNSSDEKDSKFDDIESRQTESSIGSTLCPSLCEADNSVTEISSNMRSPDIKERKNILEWMKVRRIHGKTTLSSDNRTDVNCSDSETE